MTKIFSPNYTQLPNSLIDSMSELSDAELRVAVAICRQTFGWQREAAMMSQTFLSKATGMSTVACSKAGKSLFEKGIVEIIRTKSINVFKLVVENLPDCDPIKADNPLTPLSPPINADNRFASKPINAVNTKKERTPKEKEINRFELPEVLKGEDFETAWKMWLEDRRERKKPVSCRAAQLQLSKMEKWGKTKSITAIKNSIENGWSGLFEPKDFVRGQRPPPLRQNGQGMPEDWQSTLRRA